MRDQNRKVLKLGVSVDDLVRFVRAHEELGTKTLSETLGALLDIHESTRSKNDGSS